MLCDGYYKPVTSLWSHVLKSVGVSLDRRLASPYSSSGKETHNTCHLLFHESDTNILLLWNLRSNSEKALRSQSTSFLECGYLLHRSFHWNNSYLRRYNLHELYILTWLHQNPERLQCTPFYFEVVAIWPKRNATGAASVNDVTFAFLNHSAFGSTMGSADR